MGLFHKISASDKRLLYISLRKQETTLDMVRKLASDKKRDDDNFQGHIVSVDCKSSTFPSSAYYQNGILLLNDLQRDFLCVLFQVDVSQNPTTECDNMGAINEIRTALSEKKCAVVIATDKATQRILRKSKLAKQYKMSKMKTPPFRMLLNVIRRYKNVFYKENQSQNQ